MKYFLIFILLFFSCDSKKKLIAEKNKIINCQLYNNEVDSSGLFNDTFFYSRYYNEPHKIKILKIILNQGYGGSYIISYYSFIDLDNEMTIFKNYSYENKTVMCNIKIDQTFHTNFTTEYNSFFCNCDEIDINDHSIFYLISINNKEYFIDYNKNCLDKLPETIKNIITLIDKNKEKLAN